MVFTKLTEIELPAAFDAHVHLRDGEMSQLVTPTIRKGGVNQVYVMVSEHCPLDSRDGCVLLFSPHFFLYPQIYCNFCLEELALT
jgi:dihydroorotase